MTLTPNSPGVAPETHARGKPELWALGIILIATSTLVMVPISVGFGNIYPAHLIALAFLPMLFGRDPNIQRVRRIITLGLALSLLAAAPAVFLPEPWERYRYVLQLSLNAITLLFAFSLFMRLSRPQLRSLITASSILLLVASILQILIAPEMNVRETSTFGIPRPVLGFPEEGWVGQFSALLFCGALALRLRFAVCATGFLVVLSDNRGAMMILIVAALFALPYIQRSRPLRVIVLAIPIVIAVMFILTALTDITIPYLGEGDSELNTRRLDVLAILSANNETLLPWGGETLQVLDIARDRQLSTMNVWIIDLLWRFGLGGLFVFGIWAWILLRQIPGSYTPAMKAREYWVPLAGLFSLIGNLQFNNAAGYSWTWVLIGLLSTVMVRASSFDGAVLSPARDGTSISVGRTTK